MPPSLESDCAEWLDGTPDAGLALALCSPPGSAAARPAAAGFAGSMLVLATLAAAPGSDLPPSLLLSAAAPPSKATAAAASAASSAATFCTLQYRAVYRAQYGTSAEPMNTWTSWPSTAGMASRPWSEVSDVM